MSPVHPSSGHSQLGPSSAHRWMNCPGSVRACADAPPQPPSEFAAEGTVAHGWAESLVTEMTTDGALLERVGQIMKQEGFEIEITEEMVNAAIEYRDVVDADTEALSKEGRAGRIHGKAEVQVKSAALGLFGTADYLLYQKGNKLKVYDFKYGKGVAVSPEENPQMALYAFAAMESEAGFSFDEIELVIIQPRAGRDSVKRWVASKEWLNEFWKRISQAVQETKKQDAPLRAGDWCRWCAAKATCPEIFKNAQERAMVEFSKVPPAIPDVSALSVEQMSQALLWEDHINSWFEALKLHIRGLLDAGEEVPGWKLVEGKSNRKYTDENAVISEFSPILGEAALFEKKLLSPAKLEKLVGKGKLEHLTFKPEAPKAIARDTDPRPAAARSAIEDFAPVTAAVDPLNELLGTNKLWP